MVPNFIQGVPSRFVQAVRALDEPYFMREEVASMLGTAASTLKVWGQQHPELGPYGYLEIENRFIYLYRPQDVTALRAYQLAKYPLRADGTRVRRKGRPKLWNEAERAERGREHRRIAYLLQRARKFEAEGAEHRQLAILAEIEQRRVPLRAAYQARFAEVTRPHRRPKDWLAAEMQVESVSELQE